MHLMPLVTSLLSQQLFDHLASKLAQLLEASRMVVGQAVVIESKQVKESDVDIPDVMHALDSLSSQLISSAHRGPTPGSSTRKPHCHRLGIVVTAVGLPPSHSVVGSPAEFSTEKHEGVLQHVPLLEILEESRDRLVHRPDQGPVGPFNVVVTVPVASISLNKANSTFH